MAVDGLLAVGGILSLALGISGILLIRTQKQDVIWNKHYAAQLLCWSFVCKGIANGVRSVGYEVESWRFVLYTGHFADQIFACSVMMISLLYPVPLLRNRKQFKIGLAGILIYAVISLGAAVFLRVNTPLAGLGDAYIFCGFIWTMVYLKFRFMKGHEDDKEVLGVSDAAILLFIMVVGHILFRWVGFFAASDYFYFLDTYGGDFEADYLWSMGLASAAILGLVILLGEIYQTTQGRGRATSYLVFVYMTIGLVGHIVLSGTGLSSGGGGTAAGENYTAFQGVWTEITSAVHFTMMRPILGLYILFRFGLVRISEDNQHIGKTMSIVLIVVATSALLEIIQSLMPLTEMLSAGILGVAIAFGIGWEERSFQSLISNPLRFPLRTKGGYFPEIKFEKAEYNRLDRFMAVVIVFSMILALILELSSVNPFQGGG